ncbi:hypothetical protein FHR36_004659 [Kitasatospora paracochleata]|uniref:Uncharacterized protein n=1 Tax=Kitasatospora paracochleata TaxID=58354 RepID=A0ABT1J244_9ACTN|nr:hypothetical protein [Kitasatospora paracochleata]
MGRVRADLRLAVGTMAEMAYLTRRRDELPAAP